MEQLKEGPPEPLMMSGPHFGQDRGWWPLWRKNLSNIVLAVIAVLIIVGGVYLYSNYQKSVPLGSPDQIAQEQKQQEGIVKPEQINLGEENQVNQTAPLSNQSAQEPAKEKAELVKSENGKFIVRANQGAGVTHLARKAAKEYLNLHPELEEITPEHKIYIEDYLKDKTGSSGLKPGQELTFDEGLIKEAIDQSQKLSENQLQNLHQYVLLVPSLSP